MASVARSVGRRRQLEDWKALPWKNIQRDVFRLQQRIYKLNVVDNEIHGKQC